MKQKKTPTSKKTISESLADVIETAKEKHIQGYVFVGIYQTEKPDDSVQQFFYGVSGCEIQLLGGLDVAKREILNQIPELKKGEI